MKREALISTSQQYPAHVIDLGHSIILTLLLWSGASPRAAVGRDVGGPA